jgi:hypothetical protein
LIAAINPIEGLFQYSKQQKPFEKKTFLPQGVKAVIMDRYNFWNPINSVALFIPRYFSRCNPNE